MVMLGALAVLMGTASVVALSPRTSSTVEERAAEGRARREFFRAGPILALIPYKVDVGEMTGVSLFHQHRIFWVRGFIGGARPATANTVIAVDTDLSTYRLPDQFNELLDRERIVVDSEMTAISVGRAYLDLLGASIVEAPSDIPHQDRGLADEVAGLIRPVRILQQRNEYSLDLYTWQYVGGIVERWTLLLNHSGVVEAKREQVATRVGDFVGIL